LRQHQETLNKLEAFQVPIGIACLVLGLVHLLMAGMWLF
jgi:hypothetical protein